VRSISFNSRRIAWIRSRGGAGRSRAGSRPVLAYRYPRPVGERSLGRRRRGRRYCNSANRTAPCLGVRAFWAKMSRITPCGRSPFARGSSPGCAAGPVRGCARRQRCRSRPRGRSHEVLDLPNRGTSRDGRVTSLEDSRDHVGTAVSTRSAQFVELVIELVLGDARGTALRRGDLLAMCDR